jgi:hypothetical protein
MFGKFSIFFPFPSFSFSSLFLRSLLPHEQHLHRQQSQVLSHSSRTELSRHWHQPPHGSPHPQAAPPSPPTPSPLSSLSSELPHGLPWSSNSGHGCPPMRSFNQGHFSSWDDQNGCARPPSCYLHPHFYPKRTLISDFFRILFFN